MSIVTSPLINFAQAANAVMSDELTPGIVRKCFQHYISELKDALPPDAKRRLDGIEAEAVITEFLTDVLLQRGESPQSSSQSSPEQLTKSANTGE